MATIRVFDGLQNNQAFLSRLTEGSLEITEIRSLRGAEMVAVTEVGGREFFYVFQAADAPNEFSGAPPEYGGDIVSLSVRAGDPVAGELLYTVDGFSLPLQDYLGPDATISPDARIFGGGEVDILEIDADSAADSNRVEGRLTATFGPGEAEDAVRGLPGKADTLVLPGVARDYTAIGDDPLDFTIDGAAEGFAIRSRLLEIDFIEFDDGTLSTAAFLNDPPEAQDDAAATPEDTPLTGANVLIDNGNGADFDPDGDPLSVTQVGGSAGNLGAAVAGSAGGLFTIAGDGTLDFDPDGAFEFLGKGESKETSVTYTISDGRGEADSATLTLTVEGVNDPPEARDDAFQGAADTALTDESVLVDNGNGADSDIDGDALTVSQVAGSGGNVGAAVVGSAGGLFTIGEDGTLEFAPGEDFADLAPEQARTTSLTYTVADGQGGSDTATVEVTVQGENDPPLARDDAFSTLENQPLSAENVLADNGNGVDSDPDGDALTVTKVAGSGENVDAQVAGSAGGLFTIGEDGTLDFAPGEAFDDLAPDETRTTTVTYTVGDGRGGSGQATVEVTVDGENDAPVVDDAAFDLAFGIEVGTAIGTVTGSDPEGDTLQDWTITAGNPNNDEDATPAFAIDPDSGTITLADGGDLGIDNSFTLKVAASDGTATAEPATVVINGVPDILIESVTEPADREVLQITADQIFDEFDQPDDGDETLSVPVTVGDQEETITVTSANVDFTDAGAIAGALSNEINTVFGDAPVDSTPDDGTTGSDKAEVQIESSRSVAFGEPQIGGTTDTLDANRINGEDLAEVDRLTVVNALEGASFSVKVTNGGVEDTATVVAGAGDTAGDVRDALVTAINTLSDVGVTAAPAELAANELLISDDNADDGGFDLAVLAEAAASNPITALASADGLDYLGLSSAQQLAGLYVGYYGRAPDPAGLAYWEAERTEGLAAGKGDGQVLDDIAESFRRDGEAQGRYPFLATDAGEAVEPAAVAGFVQDVFANLFNRDASAEGLAFWTGEIESRLDAGIKLGDIIVDIMAGAQDDAEVDIDGDGALEIVHDARTLANKIQVAQAYVRQMAEDAYSLGEAVDIVGSVTASTDSVDQALAALDV